MIDGVEVSIVFEILTCLLFNLCHSFVYEIIGFSDFMNKPFIIVAKMFLLLSTYKMLKYTKWNGNLPW